MDDGRMLGNAKDKIKRWNLTAMLGMGHQLFTKINKRKRAVNHNHEIHFLAREINDWLPKGIKSLILKTAVKI